EMLGVSRASAGEMLKRLEVEGLIERGARKEALLTASGRVRAERVVREHRIIERLLTDFMGYTAAAAPVPADEHGQPSADALAGGSPRGPRSSSGRRSPPRASSPCASTVTSRRSGSAPRPDCS